MAKEAATVVAMAPYLLKKRIFFAIFACSLAVLFREVKLLCEGILGRLLVGATFVWRLKKYIQQERSVVCCVVASHALAPAMMRCDKYREAALCIHMCVCQSHHNNNNDEDDDDDDDDVNSFTAAGRLP